MKAELNNENKAKFLDLYIGQESDNSAFAYSEVSRSLNDMVALGFGDYAVKLKPIKSISDEDARDCNYVDARQFHFYLRKRSDCPELYDILRSKGYALPWMGLSVEEMVDAGWIKLNES